MWEHFVNWKQQLFLRPSILEERRGRGSSALLNWTIRDMFCRCPGAAPTTLEKTIDPRSESKSAIEPGVPAPWSVSSNPRLSAAGAAMTQPKLLRCDSPRTHHAGGQLWGRTELAESCFCFCQRARAPFEHPHTVPGALHRRTDQPEGIFISPVPSQSPTWLPEESL